MKIFILSAFLLSGCAALIDPAHHGTEYMKKSWASVPPGVADLCDRVAEQEGFKAGKHAHGLVICKDQYDCTCVIGFDKYKVKIKGKDKKYQLK